MVRRFRCSEWDEGMIERDDGEYVDYADYAKLKTAFDELLETAGCLLDRCGEECYRKCDYECKICEFTADIHKAKEVKNNE